MAVDFAVWHEGIENDADGKQQGRWVIAVEGERLLLSDNDRNLYWKDVAECKLFGFMGPDHPRPVLVVQPQAQPQILPAGMMPNRAIRRNGNN